VAVELKETLNLPKTDFPMKADLAKKEEEYLKSWEKAAIYPALKKALEGRPLFMLHDGPPYANGHLHMGHALNKILKDIINRVEIKKGKSIAYIPGWDCHGLPIEHKVLKDLGKRRGDLSDTEIRARCRESAETFAGIQAKEFQRMGILGEFENPYLTMSWDFEAEILRSLAQMVEDDRVYKGEKPVLWCGVCETALADAEVEYAPHRSTAVTVLFESVKNGKKRYYPIWTTTPWTLPANQAVAVGPDIFYTILEIVEETGPLLKGVEIVVSSEILEKMRSSQNSPWKEIVKNSKTIAKVRGSELVEEGPSLAHPIIKGKKVPLVGAAFVGTDQGTGLVHIAPGHGEEDFKVGEEHKLSRETPVNERGRYGETIREHVEEWVGKKIGELAPEMVAFLEKENTLLQSETIEHSYPHCWRCKNPVYYRATSQWFLSLERKDLRSKTLNAIGTVTWIPEKGENRIRGMIETRPDWCLSRQRAWGVPIPAVHCRKCNKTTLDPLLVNKMADRTDEEGLDFWFDDHKREAFLADYHCTHCGGSDIEREKDILDVWFDSGVSHEAVLKKRKDTKWPADLYLEGSDQHRGWFHSSLLTSMALEGAPPYRSVLTHGFVVDGQGRKMAKTLGNVISPKEITDKYGADVLRLWVASADYQEDTRLSSEIVNNMVDSYRKIRNTIRFILGNIDDLKDGAPGPLSPDPLDRWVLSVWERTKREILSSYNEKKFSQVISQMNNFCAVTLSAHYFDIAKDRLYAEASGGPLRRGTQKTLRLLLDEILPLIHPILPFTTTEIVLHDRTGENYKQTGDRPDLALLDIVTRPFPALAPERENASLEQSIERLLEVRSVLGKISDDLKKEKIIRTTMELWLDLTGETKKIDTENLGEDFLENFFIVSRLTCNEGGKTPPVGEAELGVAEGRITLYKAPGTKCERCWLIRENTGKNAESLPVCKRCYKVVKGS